MGICDYITNKSYQDCQDFLLITFLNILILIVSTITIIGIIEIFCVNLHMMWNISLALFLQTPVIGIFMGKIQEK